MENFRKLNEEGIAKLLESGYQINQEEANELIKRFAIEISILKKSLQDLESFVMKLSDEETRSFSDLKQRVKKLEGNSGVGGGISFLDK